MSLSKLGIQVYADGANLDDIRRLAADPNIAGITTNPTLMRKAGVTDYELFARGAIEAAQGKPISFEVLSDDPEEIRVQAIKISGWGKNVYVKVPIIRTNGEALISTIWQLAQLGIKVNVTAILSNEQVDMAGEAVAGGAPSILSVFAGRIADTGRDPKLIIKRAKGIAKTIGNCQVLWASTREVYNVVEATWAGADIITVPPDILAKLEKFYGYDLHQLSKETVQMFVNDAKASNISL